MIGYYKSSVKRRGGDQPRGFYGMRKNGKVTKMMQPQKRDIYENRRFAAELNLVFSLRCFPDVFRWCARIPE